MVKVATRPADNPVSRLQLHFIHKWSMAEEHVYNDVCPAKTQLDQATHPYSQISDPLRTMANSVDPDQNHKMPQNTASVQSLHSFHEIQKNFCKKKKER